jgi:hypothetical protein
MTTNATDLPFAGCHPRNLTSDGGVTWYLQYCNGRGICDWSGAGKCNCQFATFEGNAVPTIPFHATLCT